MPYLKGSDRARLDSVLREMRLARPFGQGFGADLNYLISALIGDRKPSRYVEFQEVIGALECCKQEIYCRMVAPYERAKAADNGDIPGFPVLEGDLEGTK